jgi:hypothetical protein
MWMYGRHDVIKCKNLFVDTGFILGVRKSVFIFCFGIRSSFFLIITADDIFLAIGKIIGISDKKIVNINVSLVKYI